MYDDVQDGGRRTTEQKLELTTEQKLEFHEKWACLVAVASDSWEDIYLEKSEWESSKPGGKPVPAKGSGFTFFPGRSLFGEDYRKTKLKQELKGKHEARARFSLQMLCDVSRGNMRGLYVYVDQQLLCLTLPHPPIHLGVFLHQLARGH